MKIPSAEKSPFRKVPVLKSGSLTESSSPGEKEPLCQRGKIPSFTGAQGRSPCAEEFLFCRDRRSLFVNGKIFLNWRALLFFPEAHQLNSKIFYREHLNREGPRIEVLLIYRELVYRGWPLDWGTCLLPRARLQRMASRLESYSVVQRARLQRRASKL